MNKWLIGLVAIIVLAGGWFYFSQPQAAEGESIKIGAILPLTGMFAENGENSLKGYQLAVEEINEKGGILGRPVELVVESHDGDDSTGAVNAYRNLKLRGIELILGPNHTPTGLAVAPVACEEGTLLISPAIGGSSFASSCKTILNVWPVDFRNSKTLGAAVVDQGYERVAVIGSVQSWELEQAEAAAEGVQEAGGTLTIKEITNNQPGNYLTEAQKVLSSNPDAVVFTNYGYMDIVAKRLRELGSDAKFYVVILDESRKEAAGGAFEDSIIISSYTPEPWFLEKFEDRYATAPDFPADTSYDAVMVLLSAIQETRSVEPETISSHILGLDNYNGASGTFAFIESGDVVKESIFQTVRNNEIVEVE